MAFLCQPKLEVPSVPGAGSWLFFLVRGPALMEAVQDWTVPEFFHTELSLLWLFPHRALLDAAASMEFDVPAPFEQLLFFILWLVTIILDSDLVPQLTPSLMLSAGGISKICAVNEVTNENIEQHQPQPLQSLALYSSILPINPWEILWVHFGNWFCIWIRYQISSSHQEFLQKLLVSCFWSTQPLLPCRSEFSLYEQNVKLFC